MKKDDSSHEVKKGNKKVLILANSDIVIYNFRLELIERLLNDGFEVHLSSPYGERIKDLTAIGAIFHKTEMERHGMNPIHEYRLLKEYTDLVRKIEPGIVLTFTIKPNIYGGIASRKSNVPFITNITGLGLSIENGGVKQHLINTLYKIGIRNALVVFFQNESNLNYMKSRGMINSRYALIPGSGVNLDRFSFETYPDEKSDIIFSTIGRIMEDKGTDELIEAAATVKKKYPEVRFRLIGYFDGEYESKVNAAVKDDLVEYIEHQTDVKPYIRSSFAVIQPSHHEGMSNILLESSAIGRPVIASNIPGCRETFDEGETGLGFKVRDAKSLAEAVIKFIELPYEKKVSMGIAARQKVEKEFARSIVVDKYMKEINGRLGVSHDKQSL